jgi:hypothetical protein
VYEHPTNPSFETVVFFSMVFFMGFGTFVRGGMASKFKIENYMCEYITQNTISYSWYISMVSGNF